MKYAWIREHRKRYPVRLMCDIMDVSRSGYYGRLGRKPSLRAERTDRIKQTVQQVYDEHHGIYGSYKIADVMRQRDELESACRNTVARAMRDLCIKSRVCKAFKPTTTQADPSKWPAANRLVGDVVAPPPVDEGLPRRFSVRVGSAHARTSTFRDSR